MTDFPVELKPDLYFSYSQVFVYDASIQMPACAWTEAHSSQGFARREGTVAFGTLLEFGLAKVVVTVGEYKRKREHERVIAVPFTVVSGTVIVNGPDETETGRDRNVAMPSGNYRLIAAQTATGNDQESIDLVFEPVARSLERSEVLIADHALSPPSPLIETAGIPGE